LVLGAGGIVGAAYHAGVLGALAEAGWDAREADVVVGTSAGSGVGATLRAGLAPSDHLARAVDEPLSAEGSALLAAVGPPQPLRLPTRRSPGTVAAPVPANLGLLARSALRPWRLRPGVALAGLLPAGTFPSAVVGDRVRALHDRWPARSLWICALRLRDGELVVFGRAGAPETDVGSAVEASSAIPGYFTPVGIDGERYVDGGAHSPTNSDLLADTTRAPELDHVVVISPMSATPRALRRPSLWARPMHARRLADEVRVLRRSGIAVHVFQPTPADVAAMGANAMAFDRRNVTARTARDSAIDKAADVARALTRSGGG
jgi:NTE family protein